MYSDINKVKRSKRYLIDAIKSVKKKEESKYFKEGLSLLGVYLDSDFIVLSQVLAEPQLEVNLEDDVGITLDITLKPETREDPILDLLAVALEATDTGMFMYQPGGEDEEEIKQNKMLRELSTMMIPRGTEGFEEDPVVTLFFGEDSIYLQRYKLLGEEYYLFSLTERSKLDKEVYEHTLNILFKEKGSSYETFYSPLVGHKLDKRVTHRMLQGMSNKNITGMFVGGVAVVKKGFRAETFAVTNSDIRYDKEERLLSLRTLDTHYLIELDALESSEVRVNDAGKYTIVLNLENNTQLYIYMG